MSALVAFLAGVSVAAIVGIIAHYRAESRWREAERRFPFLSRD